MPFHFITSMSLWPARGLFLGCATAVDLVVTGRFWIDIRGTTFDQPSKYITWRPGDPVLIGPLSRVFGFWRVWGGETYSLRSRQREEDMKHRSRGVTACQESVEIMVYLPFHVSCCQLINFAVNAASREKRCSGLNMDPLDSRLSLSHGVASPVPVQ